METALQKRFDKIKNKKKKITVNDRMQKNYTYEITAKEGDCRPVQRQALLQWGVDSRKL